jgi:hypothetical protein
MPFSKYGIINTFHGFSNTTAPTAPPANPWTLTGDYETTSFTVSGGEVVNLAGYRFSVRGKLLVKNNGIMRFNGSDGGTLGQAGSGAVSPGLGTGTNGGAGGDNGVGSNGSAQSPVFCGFGGKGGAGGNGGANAGGVGGDGGVTFFDNLYVGNQSQPSVFLSAWFQGIGTAPPYSPTLYKVQGGTGGGGGGSNFAGAKGGGGGGGGGVVYISAQEIEIEAGGFIQAKGGKGGIPAAIMGSLGGGGGGGGGTIILHCGSLIIGDHTLYPLDTMGGDGVIGAGGGAQGVDGADGYIWIFSEYGNCRYTGYLPSTGTFPKNTFE